MGHLFKGRMARTHLRAKAAFQDGGSATSTPAVADAFTQKELLQGEAALQTTMQEMPRPFSWGRDRQKTCLQKVCQGGEPPAAGGLSTEGGEKAE